MKRVLVTPLDWGLGHASRCVPVIRELMTRDCEVMIGGSGDSLVLLKLEFPNLRFFLLPSYAPAYQTSGAMAPKIALQIPKFLAAIRGEHKRLQQIIRAEGIDLVISDHRYGCWSPIIPSVFITHQYVILPPQGYLWAAGLINRAHQKMIKRFSMCWIPDLPGDVNLAGILSGHEAFEKEDESIRYLGYLSGLRASPSSTKQFDVVCLLSGPEPQRSILEGLLVSQLAISGLKYFVVRGLPSNHVEPIENSVNFVHGDQLESILNAADVVIARSGYSTVMDLARLGKKAIFIPTPGQPEQEYLAQRLMKNHIAYASGQQNFDFAAAWEASVGYTGFQPTPGSASLLSDALSHLFMLNGNKQYQQRHMKAFISSVAHAIRGLVTGIREHRNLKVQTGVAIVTIVAGIYLDITGQEWCLVLLCIGLVISLELLNSAMEELVNLVAPERRPLAGKIKDLAAGSVLFFSVVSLCVGIILFRKYLIE